MTRSNLICTVALVAWILAGTAGTTSAQTPEADPAAEAAAPSTESAQAGDEQVATEPETETAAKTPAPDTAPDYTGLYVAFGGTVGVDMAGAASFNASGVSPVAIDDIGAGIGFNARLGNRSRNFGLEALIEAIPNFKGKAGGSELFKYSHVTLGGNARFYLPFGRIHPNALVGGGYDLLTIRSNGGGSGTDGGGQVRAGGGIDFFVNEDVALTTDVAYAWTFGDIEGTDFLAIGFGFLYLF